MHFTATFIFQALSLPGPARWAMTLQVSAVGMTDSPSQPKLAQPGLSAKLATSSTQALLSSSSTSFLYLPRPELLATILYL